MFLWARVCVCVCAFANLISSNSSACDVKKKKISFRSTVSRKEKITFQAFLFSLSLSAHEEKARTSFHLTTPPFKHWFFSLSLSIFFACTCCVDLWERARRFFSLNVVNFLGYNQPELCFYFSFNRNSIGLFVDFFLSSDESMDRL